MSNAPTYYYATTNTGDTIPGGGGWAATTFLNDGSIGDTLTGHSITRDLVIGPGCTYHDLTVDIEGGIAFPCPITLTSLRFNYTAVSSSDVIFSTCPIPEGDPPPTGFVLTFSGKYSLDGVSWTSFTPTNMGAYATATLASVSARYVVILVHGNYQEYAQNDTMHATLRLTDYRLAYTDQAPTGTPVIQAMGACQGAINTLQWSATTCADSYDIERDSVIIQTGYVPADPAMPSYIDSPVVVGLSYTYRVRARNSAGVGPWATAVVYTPCNLVLPPSPPAPTISAMGACQGAQNTVQWNSVAGADSYDVERDSIIISTAYIGLSYVDAPVTIGQSYSYRVRARNSAGVGPWSTAVVFSPCNASSPPITTTMAIVLDVCEGRQATAWINGTVATATNYRIFLDWAGCPLPSPGQLVYDGPYLPDSLDSFLITPLNYGMTYVLRVQAYNNTGNGGVGEPFAFVPCISGCGCAVWQETSCR